MKKCGATKNRELTNNKQTAKSPWAHKQFVKKAEKAGRQNSKMGKNREAEKR